MKTKLLATLLVIGSAAFAAPAFASGYGPSPSYNPSIGAPASQQGPSAQTVAAERSQESANSTYGGVSNESSQTGTRQMPNDQGSLDRGH